MNPQPQRRALLLSAAAAGLAALPAHFLFAQDSTPAKLDVPYVPTPQEVVDAMLDMAAVTSKDVLYDLGCGDGRIVITAARRGAHGTGIDLDPVRITEARLNAKKAKVEKLVKFRQANLFDIDVSPATVVTLYLLPNINEKLRPRLWRQLKPGTRVVSHAFDMGAEWPPERTAQVEGRTIYFWTITEAHKRATAA